MTCHASDSWSLSWTSLEYVGQRAAIEFNQDFDRPGVGKLVSLPNGRATLAQMMKTERSISSDLKITIPSDLNETWVTCTNNYGAAVTKSFMLSKGELIMRCYIVKYDHHIFCTPIPNILGCWVPPNHISLIKYGTTMGNFAPSSYIAYDMI